MNPNLIVATLAATAAQIVTLISQYSAGNIDAAGVKEAWGTLVGMLQGALEDWNAADLEAAKKSGPDVV
jgi:hypothetical protein